MSSWLISQTLTIIHSHHYSCQSKHTLHTTWRALQQIQNEHVMCNSHQKQRAGWHYYCCWHSCGHSWHSWELSWVGQWWTCDTNRKQHCRTHHQQCGADHFLNNNHHHNCEQSILHTSWSLRYWSSSQPPPLSLKRKYTPCIISALNISSQTCTCCACLYVLAVCISR